MKSLVLSGGSLDLIKHGLLDGLKVTFLYCELGRQVCLHILETRFELLDAGFTLPQLRVLLDLLLLLVRDVLFEHLLYREHLLFNVLGLD